MPLDFLAFAILALACYRLTHLVVYDNIFAPVRRCFVKRESATDAGGKTIVYTWPRGHGLRRWVGEMMGCPWCAGIWVGAAVTLAYWWRPAATLWVCLFLAIAAVQSLIEAAWLKSTGDSHRTGPGPKQQGEGESDA